MKILSVSGFWPYWGRYPANVLDLDDGMTVGGGEEAFLQTAVGLRGLGHQVTAHHCGDAGVWRGVDFHSPTEDLYGMLVTGKWDVVLCWSGMRALEWVPKGAKRIFCQQLNDLYQAGEWNRVDCIVSPSAEHAKQLRTWGWRGRPHAIVHNGLDVDRYRCGSSLTGSDPLPWGSRPMDVGYWSSPDRGLHHLLYAWPMVREKIPTARLHVFYEIERYLSAAVRFPGIYGDRARMLRGLLSKAKLDESIIFHGAVPRKKLAPIQKSCRVMCYPYDPVFFCEGFCHPAGTLITTIEGMKPVEKLTLGDRVLGSSGSWREITQLQARKFEGRILSVLPACGEAIEMTDDHPVFASDNEGANFRWVPARELRAGMWLYSSTPKEYPIDSVEVPRRIISPGRIESGRKGADLQGWSEPVSLPATFPVNENLCRLVGYFAGDGNAPTRGRRSGGISFFLGTEQKAESITDLCDRLLAQFGVSPILHDMRPSKKMMAIRIHSAAIGHVFSAWCYAPDGKKRLPSWAMSLSLSLTEEILKGLWRTDGSVVEVDGARLAGFTSSSPYLIDQVRTLLGRLGRRVRINSRLHDTGLRSWSVYFSIAGDFLDYPRERIHLGHSPTFTKSLAGGAVALKLRGVESRATTETVYSLVVNQDESYHAGNFLVHNCGSVNQGIAAGCLVLTNQKDALPSLYGDAVYWLDGIEGIVGTNGIGPSMMSEKYPEWLAAQVTMGLTGELPNQKGVLESASKNFDRYTWVKAAKEMEKACLGVWTTLEDI